MTQADPLHWLLERENPSARYLALTDLLDRPGDDPEVVTARAAIPGWGPARAIFEAQWPEGYWMQPGVGYSPRHKATVWQIIFLAALGAPCTPAVERACAYVLQNSRLPDGRFSAYKTARGAVACLNGNLVRAMLQLGYEDPRLEECLEALAEMVARDGFCCRFNAGSPPPVRMRDGLPCAWGALKARGAFSEVPESQRSPAVQAAIQAGVHFLLGKDRGTGMGTSLVTGDYPTVTEPSPLWLKFGFPLGYNSDLLEALDVLQRAAPIAAGERSLGRDAEWAAAMEAVLAQRDPSGRWILEHTPDNTWGRFGQVGQPNKWVTLRALRVLKGHDRGKGRKNGGG